jgi:hypothetical protein
MTADRFCDSCNCAFLLRVFRLFRCVTISSAVVSAAVDCSLNHQSKVERIASVDQANHFAKLHSHKSDCRSEHAQLYRVSDQSSLYVQFMHFVRTHKLIVQRFASLPTSRRAER